MSKAGCEKILELAKKKEQEKALREAKACPKRFGLYKKQKRRENIQKVEKGVETAGRVMSKMFGTGKAVLSEIDRRLDGKPKKTGKKYKLFMDDPD